MYLGAVHILTGRASQGIAECEQAWRLIEIWLTHTRLSVLPRYQWVVARRPMLIFKRRSACLLAIISVSCGWCTPDLRSCSLAQMRKRSLGSVGASRPIEIIR